MKWSLSNLHLDTKYVLLHIGFALPPKIGSLGGRLHLKHQLSK